MAPFTIPAAGHLAHEPWFSTINVECSRMDEPRRRGRWKTTSKNFSTPDRLALPLNRSCFACAVRSLPPVRRQTDPCAACGDRSAPVSSQRMICCPSPLLSILANLSGQIRQCAVMPPSFASDFGKHSVLHSRTFSSEWAIAISEMTDARAFLSHTCA